MMKISVSFCWNMELYIQIKNKDEEIIKLQAINKELGTNFEIADICFFAIEPNPTIRIFTG